MSVSSPKYLKSPLDFLLIPEVACAHLGSVPLAFAYIDCVAEIGFKTIKFQHHSSLHESSHSESFRVKDSRIVSPTRYEYWNDTSFTTEEWHLLVDHARDLGLSVCFTPFSRYSAELLLAENLVDYWKIGSSDFTNYHLLDFIRSTDLPIILSTGLCNDSDILNVDHYLSEVESISYLACISKYPSSLSDFSISFLDHISDLVRSDTNVGLSDHSASLAPITISASHGYRIFEFHLTLSKHIFNFDLSASLLPTQASQLLSLISDVTSVNNFDVFTITPSNKDVGSKFLKTFFACRDLSPGHILGPDDIVTLRSSDGIVPQSSYSEIQGKTLKNPISAFQPLCFSDLK